MFKVLALEALQVEGEVDDFKKKLDKMTPEDFFRDLKKPKDGPNPPGSDMPSKD